MTTQTTVTSPSPMQQQVYGQIAPGIMQYMNQPYQQYQGPLVAGLSDIQMQALQNIQGLLGSNPFMQQTQSLLSNMMSGGGGGNTAAMMADVENRARQAFQRETSGINDRFANPNSFANSRHAMMQDQANEAFARGLSGGLAEVQFRADEAAANRQLQAAQLSQGLQNSQMGQLMQAMQAGAIPQQLMQQQLGANYAEWQQAQNHPMRMSDLGLRLAGAVPGGQTQTTQTPNPSGLAQGLGGAALVASMFGSPGGGWFNFFGSGS